MQAHVDEVGGDVLDSGHLPAVSATTNAMSWRRSSAMNDGVDEACVAHFERMPQGPVRTDRECARGHSSSRRAGAPARLGVGVARQHLEEGRQALGVEAEAGRKLPQERTELLAQFATPDAKKLASGVSTSRRRRMCVM